MASWLDGILGQIPNVGSGNLSPNTDISGKILSPDITSNIGKLLSPDINTNLKLSSNITTSFDQAGLLNLKGALDMSKKSTIFAPITIIGSPNASATSSPSQQGDKAAPLIDASTSPILLIGGAAVLLIGGVMLLGGKKK
jgi:hypothetical protein